MTSSCIVITGAAGALGGAVARSILATGGRVIAVDRRRGEARLTALSAELGPACRAVTVEGGSTSEWASALEAGTRDFGVPTGAALIAGAWHGGAPLHAAADTDERLHTMIDSNLITAYASLRALLPGFVERKRGSVVLVGSRVAAQPWTGAQAAEYTASKAAVVALAQACAAEVLEHGVRVNAVLPSTIDTPANRSAMSNADPSRWVSLPSLAGVIQFLLSDAARDISGAAIPVYGRS